MEKIVKLNLGSNTVRYPGYLNVDIQKIKEVDIVDDVTVLDTVRDGSIDSIIAHNILGQIAPDKAQPTLDLWVRKLKHGGSIELGLTDGEKIFGRYMSREYTWTQVVHSLFGNMKLLRQWHGDDAERYMGHMVFAKDFAIEMMEKAGLTNICEIQPSNHPDTITLSGIKK
jgi:predicted SAM-dependent methyltransferase